MPQPAAHSPPIFRQLQIHCQSNLGRLVIRVEAQTGAAQSKAQAPLGDREGLLNDVIGAVANGHRPARMITSGGMVRQPVAVAVHGNVHHDAATSDLTGSRCTVVLTAEA